MEKNNKFNPTLIIIIGGVILLVVLLLIFVGRGDDATETEPAASNDNQTQDDQDSNSTDTETGDNEQSPTTPTPTPTTPTPTPPTPTDNSGDGLPANWNSLTSPQKTALNPYGCSEYEIVRADNGRCLESEDGEPLAFEDDFEDLDIEFEVLDSSFTQNGDKIAVTFEVDNPTSSRLAVRCGYQAGDHGGGFFVGAEDFNLNPGLNTLTDDDVVTIVDSTGQTPEYASNLDDLYFIRVHSCETVERAGADVEWTEAGQEFAHITVAEVVAELRNNPDIELIIYEDGDDVVKYGDRVAYEKVQSIRSQLAQSTLTAADEGYYDQLTEIVRENGGTVRFAGGSTIVFSFFIPAE